ncbi:MAG: M3 family metallopeptidase [Pseudomonadota bacterium]
MDGSRIDAPWTGPFGLPPFKGLEAEAFPPAFDRAMAAHEAEIEAVKADPNPADFANTVEALEAAGRALGRVAGAFWTLAGTCSDDAIRAVEREMAPKMARHSAKIGLDADLLARLDAVQAAGLDGEQARVLRLYRERFERAGARLDEAGRARMAQILERLSVLGTQFSQNVLKDEADWTLALDEDALASLPEGLAQAARAAGEARGSGPVVTLARASVEPFLKSCPDRDLREAAWRGWASRGAQGGETDNRAIIAEVLALRAERARLLGFATFADFKLAPQMAKTPEAVRGLLDRVWAPARARALEESAALSALAAEQGETAEIAPWDRRYWAEKVRARDHALSESEISAYLPLDGVLGAAFDVAGRLFGLRFEEVEGLDLHHPDARAFEVTRKGGSGGDEAVGLFVGDWFARPSKRSGAWMSALISQEDFDPEVGAVRPVVMNVANFAKGDPALLSWDDARTLFHEMGHALHGLMSRVRYPMVSGTSVARDFVELPSQLYEHWLEAEEVLAEHARHWKTGAAMPAELIARIQGAAAFDQGFATVEYLASAYVDLEAHLLTDLEGFDALAFEAEVLGRLGMPADVAARHSAPHFLHVFAGDGYSAGYYSYMWSEVMDADAFAAFEEAGGPFAPEPAARLAETVLQVGGSVDPEAAWLAFRGRAPDPAALLRGRGLADAA